MRKHIFFVIGLVCAVTAVSVVCEAERYNYPYNRISQRDPLIPLVNERGEIMLYDLDKDKRFVLQGVIFSPGNNIVVINNEVYNDGETMQGYKIQVLNASEVRLRRDKEDMILKVEE